jgi:DNA helicase-2/ATP-dependent DNA helicase PcrA
MLETVNVNPAERAAQRALDEMFECIREHQNFRLEAGAGAGKTYSLVKALKFIIEQQGVVLRRNNQQVACITYTNVATDEITSRTDGHPVVRASTIHAFCWDLIKGFQPILRTKLAEIDAWTAKLEEAGDIGGKIVEYDRGYRHVNESHITLHHDDVLTLSVKLMAQPKFRHLLTARFPILFVDEYQDTNAGFAESIVEHFISTGDGPLIGLFGDSWQKIYPDGCGLIESEGLSVIGKEANFRSVNEIVNVLNRLRPDLPQAVRDPDATGSVAVFHSNDWVGTRLAGGHWGGDLPAEDAQVYLHGLRDHLANQGWDFSPSETKILMLTHKVLAAEQNYNQIVAAFQFNESFLKKEDPHIKFLVDLVEPACIAFQSGRFGEMFSVIGARSVNIRSLGDKQTWARDMSALVNLRETGTIGEVLDLLKQTNLPRLPEKVARTESTLTDANQEEIDESRVLSQISKLREIPYREIISLTLFINDHTPFSTKHGVKGAEFENVLIVMGRGWNHYNWKQFLEWFPDRFPANKASSYERNRNLFYVACSRPKKRLALLFTQDLSADALTVLRDLFGEENVNPFTPG